MTRPRQYRSGWNRHTFFLEMTNKTELYIETCDKAAQTSFLFTQGQKLERKRWNRSSKCPRATKNTLEQFLANHWHAASEPTGKINLLRNALSPLPALCGTHVIQYHNRSAKTSAAALHEPRLDATAIMTYGSITVTFQGFPARKVEMWTVKGKVLSWTLARGEWAECLVRLSKRQRRWLNNASERNVWPLYTVVINASTRL